MAELFENRYPTKEARIVLAPPKVVSKRKTSAARRSFVVVLKWQYRGIRPKAAFLEC